MSKAEADTTQSLKGDDWAGEMGERWLTNLDRLESMIEPIGAALLDRAAFEPGERILDVGSGGGSTTRAIAKAVGPSGEAVGVDVAPMLVIEAQKRADASGVDNARFVCADAGTVALDEAPFDRLFSRFGSMFFEDPFSSFANLRSMLCDGARIDLAVWGPPRDNLWMMEMMGVVRQHVEVPPAQPRAAGPFAFEDLDYLGDVLAKGGFDDVDVATHQGKLALGGPRAEPNEAVEFVLSSMGVGRILAEQQSDIRDRASADLLSLFERHSVAEQGIMMDCKVWLVCATA